MTRTSKERIQRGASCHEYRLSTNGKCEVSRWLVGDREAVKWMSGVCLPDTTEIHHICGRAKSPEFELPCNLLLCDRAAHAWIEHRPIEGALVSLYSKWRKHLDLFTAGKLPFDQSRWDWNVAVMNRLVRPCDGLAGRISYLLDKLPAESKYTDLGMELLHSIEGADIEF